MSYARTRVIRFPTALLLAWLLAGCAALQSGERPRGLLWQVEAEGVAPSYVYGTMHVGDPRVVNVGPPVRNTFNEARVFVMEMVLEPEAMAAIQHRMFYRDRTLQAVIGADLYARVVDALAARGLPANAAQHMKPWAALSILTLPESSGEFLDQRLQSEAQRQGKPVHGLETADEQLAAFEGIPERLQIEILADTLDNLETMDEWLEKTTLAYAAGDLAAIERLSTESMEGLSQEAVAAFESNIITERNKRMAERMTRWLDQGGAFVAVGALHLPGEEGVLSLLREQGYRVVPVRP